MSDPLERLDYYTLLQVADEAPLEEIQRAFRRFARKYHPDRFAGQEPAKIEQAARIYRRGGEAMQVLSDPKTRAVYDEALRQGKVRLTPEEQDRALRDPPAPKKDERPIRSPQAIAYFQQGVKAAHEGDWRAAWRYLKSACEAEPGNPFLEARFQHVDRRLRGY
ncbi:MAG: DnaJ domain-containing protein [Polyangiales bacterium]|nr:DnaJ domain-containing protein [Myxococcales bacterium]MCB9625443.1 DnaJ domain-containing protein [Sandaracinus sp.]